MITQSGQATELLALLQKCNKHGTSLSERLYTDSDRFSVLSRAIGGLLVDFSRTRIGDEEFSALVELAVASGVEEETIVYLSNNRKYGKPAPNYQNEVIEGAGHVGLPEDYIQKLLKWS